MFFGREMHDTAVWTSEAAVNAAVRMIQKYAGKYDVLPIAEYDHNGDLIGWVVVVCDFCCTESYNAVTKGYIAALMQRHDIPLPDPAADPDVLVQIAPQFHRTPMYAELPKIGPSSIHVRW